MAKRTIIKKENNIATIKNILKNFSQGNYDTPIQVDGFGDYYEILLGLENVRIKVLDLQNKESEITEKNKTVIANITHDMKTPLALISGYAECLQCGMDDKDYLDLILQKTSYLNELVLKIISSSKKEINDIPKLKEKLDASEYFFKEFNSYKNLAETKNIKIILSNIPKVKIFIDTKEYKSVVQNLITNSIKYGKYNGKIKVSFSKNQNYLIVKVKDNGIGISKENVPHVFDKFFMADEARSTANSGLGLSIVKNIVESNGGTITCKSKLGSYTEFTFTIPIFHEVIENDKIRETLPKIENKVDDAVSKVKDKKQNKLKQFAIMLIVNMYLLFGFIVETTLCILFVGFWLLDVFLILGSFTAFVLMGVVIANHALVPIILIFFGLSIFFLGFFFVLSSDIIKISNKLFLLIEEFARHMLTISKKVYGGGKS